MRHNIYSTVCSYRQRVATGNRDVFVFGRKPTDYLDCEREVRDVPQPFQTVVVIAIILFFLLDAHPWLVHLLEIRPHLRERLSCLIIYFMLIICTKICCVLIIIIITTVFFLSFFLPFFLSFVFFVHKLSNHTSNIMAMHDFAFPYYYYYYYYYYY